MDPSSLNQFLPQSDDDKHLGVGHKARWDLLKPIIVNLYLATTLGNVVRFMKTNYAFHAVESEYQHKLRAWKVKKRLEKKEKEEIARALGRRKRPGTSTSLVSIQQGDRAKQFNVKKLRRHLNEQPRRRLSEPISLGLFSSWNLPYQAFLSSLRQVPGEAAPFSSRGTTPEYLNIRSPTPITPGREEPGPSPNMQLVYQKAREDCASLFMQGRMKDLMVKMCEDDRRVLVNNFHAFYRHIFILAKTWGTPQSSDLGSSPTPLHLAEISSTPSSPHPSSDIFVAPTQFCRYSIHISSEPETESDKELDTEPVIKSDTFVETLNQSLSSNLNRIPEDRLPLAKEVIMESLEGNPSVLQLDAWKLAIMTGNVDLLYHLYENNSEMPPEDIDTIHPLHLAATFLDGGNKCCLLFECLCDILGTTYAFKHDVDDLGHTILDALMISILRSHTKIDTETVSNNLRDSNRFPGEENDICGRWNADTPKVCELLKQGKCRIPHQWKHPFCHTAAQAVCHSIITIFGSPVSPKINTRSGLFSRRCSECGLQLKLGPLHTLVVTAFYLAQLGMPGETLFGALAVMVCLITMGADVSLEVEVSVEQIVGNSPPEKCSHEQLSALGIMRIVPDSVIGSWSGKCQIGWYCLVGALDLAERSNDQTTNEVPGRRASPSSDESSDEWDQDSDFSSEEPSSWEFCSLELDNYIHSCWLRIPCIGPQMGLLWATIQAELLTFRKIEAEQGWVSANFSMEALKIWLEGNSNEFSTPLVQNKMLRRHSRCGWFYDDGMIPLPTSQQACREYFMNMDIYERTSFLECANLLGSWGGVRPLEYSHSA